nr:EAL domain-containing protein [uncultured Albidiferax sp.]
MFDPVASRKAVLLLVDDDPVNLRVLAKLLQPEYEVLVAADGAVALDIAASNPMPDIVLLDVEMPDIDGYAVCKRLKSDAATRHIPVIFVTAKSTPDAEEYGLSIGAVDYVAKPFTPSVVCARVYTQLRLRGLISELEDVNRALNEKLTLLQKQHEMLAWYSTELGEVKSRQRLFAQVFESTSDGVIITSKTGEILAVNASFTSICGYDESEVLGRNPRMLKSGRHEPVFFEIMWERISRLGSWTGEIWNRRKSNEVFAELLSISTVYDDEGGVACYVGVFNDVSRFKEVQDRMEFLTWHDAVTGLPNRSLFSDRLVQTLGSSAPPTLKGVVMVFDIENFSDVNASRGMQMGDDALARIAQRLTDGLEHGLSLSRLGGAHFAVLMPPVYPDSATAAQHASEAALRVRRVLHEFSEEMESDLFHLRGTVGVAIYPESPTEVAGEIVRRAESARREAKAAGGDTITFYQSGMGEAIEGRLKDEHSLRAAIAKSELRVFLQSQVDGNGVIQGAEALVRWQHPVRGLLAPGLFIPQAEFSYLIVELDRWMLTAVCRLLAYLDANGCKLPISVNISARHFRESDFVEFVSGLLRQHQILPGRLVLEVTEGMMLNDVPQVIDRMNTLTALGLQFSIDDFGTGYSNLAYLKQLPVRELKIDQSFVQGLGVEKSDAALIEVILDIALRFDLHVVAEGVETEQQADFLRQRGVSSMQGYFFSRPNGVGAWLQRMGLTSNEWG